MFFFSCGTCRAKSCKQAVRAGLQYKEKVTTGSLLSRTKGKKFRYDYNDDNNNDNNYKEEVSDNGGANDAQNVFQYGRK